MTESTPRAELVAALTQRLRNICADWPEQEFRAMVEQLADITLKYEGTSSAYDRRTADRMVTELNQALERSRASQKKPSAPDGGTVSAIVFAVQQIVSSLATRPI